MPMQLRPCQLRLAIGPPSRARRCWCCCFRLLLLLCALGLTLGLRACAGELSSLPQEPQAGAGENDPGEALERQQLHPSASLLSTAMRPSPPPPQRRASPQAQRANSVVSKTALGATGHHPGGAALRAGTPASIYGQGQSLGRRARTHSPHDSHAVEQVLIVKSSPLHGLRALAVLLVRACDQ